VSTSGSNEVLKRGIKENIDELLRRCDISKDDIDGIIASGMITSNVGLADIPHVPAPAGIDELSSSIVEVKIPEVAEKPICFIPGIKTGFCPETNIFEKDIMRGEEIEIMGFLSTLDMAKKIEDMIFMHYGSHHKCISVSDGKIVSSCTSITGELMMTIFNNTILKSSLLPISELKYDMKWIKAGLETGERLGFGRALFNTRILDVMDRESKNNTTNFFIGILISMDLQFVREAISPSTKKVVLYGKKLFPSVFSNILEEIYPWVDANIVSEEESDHLSVQGAWSVYKKYIAGRC
jgi:2-dehydro-3-deoxygalactonokinase